MSYRYRILFYHENQEWVSQLAAMLDTPLAILVVTDQAGVVQKNLEAGEVDILITVIAPFLLEDGNDPRSFKQNLQCKLIILCSQQEGDLVADLVYQGAIEDYCIVNPLVDKNRLYIAVMNVMVKTMFNGVLGQQFQDEKIPKMPIEIIEMLQAVHQTPETTEKPNESLLETEQDLNAAWSNWDNQPNTGGIEQEFMRAGQEFKLLPQEDDLKTGREFTLLPQEDDLKTGREFIPLPQEDDLKTGREFAPIDTPEKELKSFYFTWGKKNVIDVLLINNNPQDIQLIQAALAYKTIKTTIARTGEEGLICLSRQEYPLLLLALYLPGQSGFDFLSRLRVKGPQPGIPTILILDKGHEEYRIKGAQAGADSFITKPLRPDRLLKAVFKYVAASA
jgi:CheY-like chemotaxis protein